MAEECKPRANGAAGLFYPHSSIVPSILKGSFLFMNEDALSRVDLFSTLDKKELQVLAKSCQERTYPARTDLFKQGETGVGLYILSSGRVRVTLANGMDKAEEEIALLSAGDIVGEMALLDDLPRSATVTALEDVTALLLPIWEFRTVLRDHPDIAVKLLSVLSRRLRKAETRQQEL